MAFGRLLTAMVTPFDEHYEINEAATRQLANHLAATSHDGIVVAGTTGESPNLSGEEKLRLFQIVKETVGDRLKVVAGTGSYNTKESIALSQAAEKIGVDGVMAVVPYYSKPSQEGLYQHFRAIAESISIPVLLYNIPGRCGVNMMPETVRRLAEIPNIVALKEAAGSLDQVGQLCYILPSDFTVYSGDDSLTLPMLSVGGHGVISVAGHLVGNEIKAMINAYDAGDVKEARAIHNKLWPIFKTLFITSNPVPVKYATSQLGIPVGPVRLPLVPPTQCEKDTIDACLKQLGIC